MGRKTKTDQPDRWATVQPLLGPGRQVLRAAIDERPVAVFYFDLAREALRVAGVELAAGRPYAIARDCFIVCLRKICATLEGDPELDHFFGDYLPDAFMRDLWILVWQDLYPDRVLPPQLLRPPAQVRYLPDQKFTVDWSTGYGSIPDALTASEHPEQVKALKPIFQWAKASQQGALPKFTHQTGKKKPRNWQATVDKWFKYKADCPDMTMDQFCRSYTKPPIDKSTLSRWVKDRRQDLDG